MIGASGKGRQGGGGVPGSKGDQKRKGVIFVGILDPVVKLLVELIRRVCR